MRVMPKKKHHIDLSPEERAQLEAIVRKGRANAHCQRHARILLLADRKSATGDWSDAQIAQALQTSIPTIERVAAGLRRGRTGAGLGRQSLAAGLRAQTGRGGRSAPPSAVLRSSARGARPLDAAAFGWTAGGAGSGRFDQPRGGAPDIKKNELKP